MTKRIATGAALLFPLFAGADTLILKNGTRYQGRLNNANANQVNFTEDNGNRQNVNTYDVQEVQFGQQDGGYNGNRDNRDNRDNREFGRDSNQGGNSGSFSAAATDDLDRLQQDLQSVMSNSDFSGDQRQSLEDSAAVLRTALQQSRNGRSINRPNVRLALENIRSASDRMNSRDRTMLSDDIRRVNASMGTQGNGQGRNY